MNNIFAHVPKIWVGGCELGEVSRLEQTHSQAEQSSHVFRSRSTEIAPAGIYKEPLSLKSSLIFLVGKCDGESLATSFSCGWFRLQVGS